MFELAWKLFKLTGNIDIYLLFKELEKDEQCCYSLKRSSQLYQLSREDSFLKTQERLGGREYQND